MFKDSKIFNGCQCRGMKIMNKLLCTNHNEVHKSEADSPLCSRGPISVSAVNAEFVYNSLSFILELNDFYHMHLSK